MPGDLRTPGICSEERTAPETMEDSTQTDGQINPKSQHNISYRWPSRKPEWWVISGEAISWKGSTEKGKH